LARHPASESVEPIVNVVANPILGIAIVLLDFTLEVFAPPIDSQGVFGRNARARASTIVFH